MYLYVLTQSWIRQCRAQQRISTLDPLSPSLQPDRSSLWFTLPLRIQKEATPKTTPTPTPISLSNQLFCRPHRVERSDAARALPLSTGSGRYVSVHLSSAVKISIPCNRHPRFTQAITCPEPARIGHVLAPLSPLDEIICVYACSSAGWTWEGPWDMRLR